MNTQSIPKRSAFSIIMKFFFIFFVIFQIEGLFVDWFFGGEFVVVKSWDGYVKDIIICFLLGIGAWMYIRYMEE